VLLELRPLPEGPLKSPPRVSLCLARVSHNSGPPSSPRPRTAVSVSSESVSDEEDKAHGPKACGGHSHLMRIPTRHSDTGAQRQQDSSHVQAQQHDYTCTTMRACRLLCLDETPNTTKEQTGPQAQNSASPDAGLALGHRLRLARARPRLPAPPRIPQTTTLLTMAHVRENSTIFTGRLPPRPSLALTSISASKDTPRHPSQGH
jgi:hypothetical protein